MLKCPKCSTILAETYTKAGVIIDSCTACKGVWLEHGELNFFSTNKKLLSDFETLGLQGSKVSALGCPHCKTNLQSGQIPGFRYEIEQCPKCDGLFFDEHEFIKISGSGEFSTMQRDKNVNLEGKPKISPRPSILFRLPSLGFTSTAVLLTLYGVIFGLIVFLVEYGRLEYNVGILIAVGFVGIQFLLGPVLMDWSLRLFGSLNWVPLEALPKSFGKTLLRLCNENKIPLPRIGIIEDGSPQAYTYGRTPWSARMVFSRGIFNLLNEDEVETVLAHELGHVKHWDFIIMTLAQLAPIILYHIYRVCRKISSSGNKRNNRGKNPGAYFAVAALVAYIAYVISEYLVMFISRVREYHADRFSCYATKKPNALLSGLVKIGFGLMATQYVKDTTPEEKSSDIKDYQQKRLAVQALNIMNISSGKALALAAQGGTGGNIDPQMIKEVMRWDLWSPWAWYYELHSTHPLTAKRINAIGAHAIKMGQTPAVVFDFQKPESYWDDFIVDLFTLALPIFVGSILAAIHAYFCYQAQFTGSYAEFFRQNAPQLLITFVTGVAIGGIFKLFKIYPSGAAVPYAIAGLLKKIKVSPVRAYKVHLKGTIIGRGDSGNIFSEDLVLRDQTGLIYLDHEPFGFNFFFALFKINEFKGQEVEVEGWFRRSPIPYIEVKRIKSATNQSQSYTLIYKLVLWILLLILMTYLKINGMAYIMYKSY